MYSGRRTVAALAMTGAGTLLLTGCLGGGGDPDAGTNGVAKLPPATIERQARAAAEAAPAVRLSGTVVSDGRTYRLDMRLRANGGVGEVTANGSTFQLLRVNDALYLKAGADFYGDSRGAGAGAGPDASASTGADADAGASDKDSRAAAAKLNGKYVKVPANDPAYQQFSGFTDKKILLADVFTLNGALRVGDHRTVGDTRAIALDGSKGGSLDVSLMGAPYPLRYQRAGNAGTLTLTDWGQDFTLAAPGKGAVVDYGTSVGSPSAGSPSPSPKHS